MRKPFDLLVKGLVSKDSRGDKTPVELFRAGVGAMSQDIAVVAQGLMAHNSLA